jgi:hypothetical protein
MDASLTASLSAAKFRALLEADPSLNDSASFCESRTDFWSLTDRESFKLDANKPAIPVLPSAAIAMPIQDSINGAYGAYRPVLAKIRVGVCPR